MNINNRKEKSLSKRNKLEIRTKQKPKGLKIYELRVLLGPEFLCHQVYPKFCLFFSHTHTLSLSHWLVN